MTISTNPKPTMYRNLHENTTPGVAERDKVQYGCGDNTTLYALLHFILPAFRPVEFLRAQSTIPAIPRYQTMLPGCWANARALAQQPVSIGRAVLTVGRTHSFRTQWWPVEGNQQGSHCPPASKVDCFLANSGISRIWWPLATSHHNRDNA